MIAQFFNQRTRTTVATDLLVGTTRGTAVCSIGWMVMSTAGVATGGTLGMLALAGAIGGLIAIVPAIILKKAIMDSKFIVDMKLSNAQRLLVDYPMRVLVSFSVGCLGAAVLGMAILPVGLCAVSGALTFGLMSTMTYFLKMVTEPSTQEEAKVHYSALGMM